MSLSQLPRFQSFEPIRTNEATVASSGAILSDTRQAKLFQVILDTQALWLDTDHYFTPREVSEISQSLIEIESGNFKTAWDTDELFADLDRK